MSPSAEVVVCVEKSAVGKSAKKYFPNVGPNIKTSLSPEPGALGGRQNVFLLDKANPNDATVDQLTDWSAVLEEPLIGKAVLNLFEHCGSLSIIPEAHVADVRGLVGVRKGPAPNNVGPLGSPIVADFLLVGFPERIGEPGNNSSRDGGDQTFRRMKNFEDLNQDEWREVIVGAAFIISLGVLAYLSSRA